MSRGFRNLSDFVRALEKSGELVRIAEPVDPELEITEITDRVSKRPGGGKALLFENVKGSRFPVLINSFGSYKRMAMAMGGEDVESAAKRISDLFAAAKGVPPSMGEKLKLLGGLAELARIPPKIVTKAPCQEVVLEGEAVRLSELPILKCWPHDGGRFITLPLVITKDPETGERNVGVYRMHVYDDRSCGMHWQTQKDGAAHSEKSRRRGRKLEVAVVLGADPATVFSGVVPLPYGVDELL
ncbi:MAG TPA: UbiD family decarboxylase domain-containing protein, partial [Candidatus Eisenbacteria bacterium]|nr:UbiD family decarboxylase domain-containing protein [Candidatus Eisenbacteria bacterium]